MLPWHYRLHIIEKKQYTSKPSPSPASIYRTVRRKTFVSKRFVLDGVCQNGSLPVQKHFFGWAAKRRTRQRDKPREWTIVPGPVRFTRRASNRALVLLSRMSASPGITSPATSILHQGGGSRGRKGGGEGCPPFAKGWDDAQLVSGGSLDDGAGPLSSKKAQKMD